MGDIYYVTRSRTGEILSKSKTFKRSPGRPGVNPDVLTFRCFVFNENERSDLVYILNLKKDKTLTEEKIGKIIAALESVCTGIACVKKPDRIARKKQFEKLVKKALDFEKILPEISEFAWHHIKGPQKEICQSVSKLKCEMIRLNSLFDSIETFLKYNNGRPPLEPADVVLQGVVQVFNEFNLPFETSDDSLFLAIARECLKSLNLPYKDFSRRLNKLKEEISS